MSLFPAYSPDLLLEDSTSGEEWFVPAALECQLLASEEEGPASSKETPSAPDCADSPHFYLDVKRDSANLRVSTLYCPGRPEYRAGGSALGTRAERRRVRRRRYWQGQVGGGGGVPVAGGGEAAALRAAFGARPGDEELCVRYVAAAPDGLQAAERAAAACGTWRARDALHRARVRCLPPADLRHALLDEAARERRGPLAWDVWARLLEVGGAARAHDTAAAALAHLAHDPDAYPHVLYAYGCVLRAAGLAERLVLTVELAAAMNFPPVSGFPPARDPADERRRDAELWAREEQLCRSGLPLHSVWARVERLRAAAHWRPAADAADGDEQRAPSAAAATELVRAVRGARAAGTLAAVLLRLARVPLPGGEHMARAAGPEPAAGEPAAPELLAALFRTARRLPPTHPARPSAAAHARVALAPLLDPPHYFSDADGYLSWTNALWEACCGWVNGARRVALVCWRLRWLHALARLAEPAEGHRLRHEARATLRRHAPDAPEAFALLARLEADVAGAASGARVAIGALRAALREPAGAPAERALFVARVVGELERGPAARWALCCAVLRRPLPPDERLGALPPADLLAAALQRAHTACEHLEHGFSAREDVEEQEEVCVALLPGCGEWAAARATLAPPLERNQLLARLLHHRDMYTRGGAALQYGEQAACALVSLAAGRARTRAARDLLPLFPRNPLLALVCAGAPLWATGPAPCVSARAALAGVVPSLLAGGLAAEGQAARRLAALCVRAQRQGAAGPLLAIARLEAEARAPHHRTQAALYAALDHYPDHKWVSVRGAAWCGGEAAALHDALLERGLRLHALMDELVPPSAGTTSTTDTTHTQ